MRMRRGSGTATIGRDSGSTKLGGPAERKANHMEMASEAYKQLFCRTFLDGHRRYEPAALAWPSLNGEALALLRGLPFWTHALQAEEDAGPMITACAALEPDAL